MTSYYAKIEEAARKEEREQCAKIAEALLSHSNPDIAHAAGAIAEEIRTRPDKRTERTP